VDANVVLKRAINKHNYDTHWHRQERSFADEYYEAMKVLLAAKIWCPVVTERRGWRST
jgi:hypothetical protein